MATTPVAATNDAQRPLPPLPAPKPHAATTAAGHGKLEEVPVGPAAHPAGAAPRVPSRQARVRLGRDGKPLPPRGFRGRPRRTSADLARDALVESLMSEARVDFFAPSPADDPAHPAPTDEDLLARFEAEYRDAAEERTARKPPDKGTAADAKTGPKLGGSRSMRAAVAARERETAAAAAAAAGKGKGGVSLGKR
ncbi:hypothetical protein B5807_10973 [Epicoccum nigrum]|uniref:Uncharacterized protein n=1 Tax=Epicoccum nigrum TaxID=105696 RepID=A0A1Y2LM89_EPING|nr:hypothetical protein B5807_10973 [Epicoccum nigrum]